MLLVVAEALFREHRHDQPKCVHRSDLVEHGHGENGQASGCIRWQQDMHRVKWKTHG